MHTSRNLKELLKKHGLKQVHFASITGTDTNTVSNWVRGHTRVPDLVWLLFDVLDARPELKHFLFGMRK